MVLMGRPPKKAEDRASKLLSVRLTPDTMEWLQKAAAAEGQSVTHFVQQLLFECMAKSLYE